ncbi:methionine--tRNA ligase [Butyrivibrio sp. MC2013]|uniref:methionine--tRNA ligase n=1 Tax=Butyrivibrio sp. MC2013 TaxID=1280686 RepID=UPI0003FBA8CE|nr:methionine--tRNA ligase [Butyrivibrio sp. MC2013]
MQTKGKYYITTAIAYTSGKPHIGNTYEAILADAIARYKRCDGYDVHFQTGSDEHGQKIETRAIEAGCASPKEFVDAVSGDIRRIWDKVGTSYDRFIRTTDDDHVRQVQKMFKKFYDQGDVYKGSYKGKYCTECEAFYTDSQLNNGKCPVCGGDVHEEEEEAYFFKMSKYTDRLINYINEHPDFIQPVARKNEMMNNFLLPGVQDLCVSRSSFKWGIPVDFDPGHVVYVWLDALANYITGIGYDVDGNNSEDFNKYWPCDLHLVGKDIIRFHTIYWPIFLMALDVPLPKQIFGHPWLLQGGEKMSKSKGNVIYADDLVDIFGVDAVRYFVLHEMPFDNDGTITWELMAERFNSDLANTLGNLVNRTIAMTNKYFDGIVSNPHVDEPVDEDLKKVVTSCYKTVEEKMDGLRVADSITEIFALFKRCNKYIDETEPWILAKDEAKQDRLRTVLYNLTESIMIGAGLLYPFMPDTATRIAADLNADIRAFDSLETFGLYPDGNKVSSQPTMLFARKDLAEVLKATEEITRLQKEDYIKTQTTAIENLEKAGRSFDADKIRQNLAAIGEGAVSDEEVIDIESKPEIEYDQFASMQFQVGEVIKCEAVAKSKKLLVSQVRVGSRTLQIVSGIRKYYSPEEMVGKKVMVLVNLKPAKLAGVDSEGMLLCAEGADGELSLMVPEKKMPAGAEIA